jgi:hypothetical protein
MKRIAVVDDKPDITTLLLTKGLSATVSQLTPLMIHMLSLRGLNLAIMTSS